MKRSTFKKVSNTVSLILLLAMAFLFNKNASLLPEILFAEAMPIYILSKYGTGLSNNREIKNDTASNTYQEDGLRVLGVGDVVFQDESSIIEDKEVVESNITVEDIDKLRDINYLREHFYVVDPRTGMTEDLFNVDEFMNKDLSINKETPGAKVLIFHTHSKEMYADSNVNDINEGVVGLGNKLSELLTYRYGIQTIHDTSSYDVVDGRTTVTGAYERMEPAINEILKNNPQIEVTIDIHRDGVAETTRLVKDINGKQTAQIMFFNGLSMLNNDSNLEKIPYLPNPNLLDNLAMSFRLQLIANDLYPGLTRRIYLNAYRYSLHFLPKSILVEVGAQTNNKDEAFNAIEPLAHIIATALSNE